MLISNSKSKIKMRKKIKTSFSFSAQISPSSLLHGSTSSLMVFSHSASFHTYESTYGISLALNFVLFPLTLLLLLLCPISSILFIRVKDNRLYLFQFQFSFHFYFLVPLFSMSGDLRLETSVMSQLCDHNGRI